jgi:hypothetical protein
MPLITTPWGTVRDRPLFGGRMRAAAPVVLTVQPGSEDREPLDYDLEVTLDVVAGRMQCTDLRVMRRPGGPPVTSENLRRIPVAYIVGFASQNAGVVSEIEPDPDSPDGYREIAYQPPPKDFADRGMTTEALEHAARVYRWAVALGDKPYGVLQRDFGLPRAKAARWIATARRRGILEPITDKDDADGNS